MKMVADEKFEKIGFKKSLEVTRFASYTKEAESDDEKLKYLTVWFTGVEDGHYYLYQVMKNKKINNIDLSEEEKQIAEEKLAEMLPKVRAARKSNVVKTVSVSVE